MICPPPPYLPFLAILALIFSYSGLETPALESLPEEMRATLGRTVGMIPLAILGIYLQSYKIPERLLKYKKWLLVYIAVIGICCLSLPFFAMLPENYGYQGLKTITLSLCLFFFFYLLPLEKCPQQILVFIQNAAKYTMGVYCIHRMIRHIIRTVTHLESQPLIFAVSVFTISYILSWLFAKLPWKWIKVSVA